MEIGAPDSFCVISGPAEHEIKVKGSRFIAEARPARRVEDALAVVDEISRREHSATHHCWAYRIGSDGADFRYNDDGEPAGTAGAPILRQIEGHDLVDIIVVVTRYFGGTKLGTGGLIRAYGEATARVLELAPVATQVVRVGFSLQFSYDDTSAAMQTLSRFDVVVQDSIYADDTRLEVAVRRSQAAGFKAAFIENLSGRGSIRRLLT